MRALSVVAAANVLAVRQSRGGGTIHKAKSPETKAEARARKKAERQRRKAGRR